MWELPWIEGLWVTEMEKSSPFQPALFEGLSMSKRWINVCVNMNQRGHAHNWVILKRGMLGSQQRHGSSSSPVITITTTKAKTQCLQQLFNQMTYKKFLQWLTDLTEAVIRTQTAGLLKFNSLSKHPFPFLMPVQNISPFRYKTFNAPCQITQVAGASYSEEGEKDFYLAWSTLLHQECKTCWLQEDNYKDNTPQSQEHLRGFSSAQMQSSSASPTQRHIPHVPSQTH